MENWIKLAFVARGISASKTVVSGYPTFVSRKLTLVYYLLPFCFCFLLLELLTLASLILIGEIQGYPVGDALYSAKGNTKMEIYYAKTQFGHPWIILGDAISEEAFLCEVEADEDFQSMELQGQPVKITVTYLTENDFPDPVKIT